MGKNILILVFMGLSLFAAGCSLESVELPKTDLRMKFNLQRSEYRVLGNATGKACASKILFWATIPNKFAPFTWDIKNEAKEQAFFAAVKSQPKADTIVHPLYETELFSIPGLFTSVCVKATGKAIQIKTDGEIRK